MRAPPPDVASRGAVVELRMPSLSSFRFASLVILPSGIAVAIACGPSDEVDPSEDFDSGAYSGSDAASKGEASAILLDAAPGQTCIGQCVVQLGVGGTNACALFVDGTVRCWGSNLSGQLGVVGPTSASLPAEVQGIGATKALAVGGWHVCALSVEGTVRCWGRNSDGELALPPDSVSHPVPSEVKGLPKDATVVDVAAGSFHACVRTTGDRVACWGYNSLGQVGTGTAGSFNVTPSEVPTPTVVSAFTGAKSLTLGGSNTCATKTTGVECLGSNVFGQLARNSDKPPTDPTPKAATGIGGSIATFLHATGRHFALALQDGRVQAWGSNTSGESAPMSDGGADILAPAFYPGITDAESVTAGDGTTCIVTREHTVKCWGRNNAGQAGQDTLKTVTAPTLVPGLSNVYRVALSSVNFACALTYDGQVYCWGANDSGQLGDGTTKASVVPVKVKF